MLNTRKEIFELVSSKTAEELAKQFTAKELIGFQNLLCPMDIKLKGNKLYQVTRCKDMADSLRRSQKLLGIEI